MGKISQLTGEQQALFPGIRDRWIRAGLATGPADRAAAEQGVRLAYETADLPAPELFIWLDSPWAGTIGQALLRIFPLTSPGQVEDQVWNQVEDQVKNQVWDQVWNQVENQVKNQVWDQVSDQVLDQVRNQVGNQ